MLIYIYNVYNNVHQLGFISSYVLETIDLGIFLKTIIHRVREVDPIKSR